MTQTPAHTQAQTLSDETIPVPPKRVRRTWGQRGREWLLGSMPLVMILAWFWDVQRGTPQTFLGAFHNLMIIPMILFVLLVPMMARDGTQFSSKRNLMPFLAAMGLWIWTVLVNDTITPFAMFQLLFLLFLSVVAIFGWKLRELEQDAVALKWSVVTAWSFAITGTLSVLGMIGFPYDLPSHLHVNFFLYVPGFANVRTMGDLATVGVAMTWALALITKQKTGQTVLLLMTGVAGLALFWSGTRAGIVVLPILALAFLFWAVAKKQKQAWFALAGGVSVLTMGAIATLTVLPIPAHNSYGLRGDRLQEIVHYAENLPQVSTGSFTPDEEPEKRAGRLFLWTFGIESLMEKPWTGYGHTPLRSQENRPENLNYFHYHNVLLEILVSYGLILGTALLTALGWGLWRILALTQHNPKHLPITAGCWTVLLVGLNSGIYTTPVYLILWAFWMAYAWKPFPKPTGSHKTS